MITFYTLIFTSTLSLYFCWFWYLLFTAGLLLYYVWRYFCTAQRCGPTPLELSSTSVPSKPFIYESKGIFTVILTQE